jgi:GTP-binding protein
LPKTEIFSISAATLRASRRHKYRRARLIELPAAGHARREETLEWLLPEVDQRVFSVDFEGQGRVRGKKIERLISMTNFAQPECCAGSLAGRMQASGISDALRRAGIQEGDGIHREGRTGLDG